MFQREFRFRTASWLIHHYAISATFVPYTELHAIPAPHKTT